jgi:predicted TIM-barrel fold metal-dependent hydrolase
MRAAGRFVVEAHGHITTLYKSKGTPPGDYFGGLTNTFSDGEVEYFDNSPLTLYDMERYGVDMVLLKPSQVGNTNESQADLVDRYPDKFRAFCADMKLRIKCARGEAKWNLDDAAAEVEAALQTGKFIGIGEFVPRDMDEKKVYTFAERLNEYRTFCELAQKYNVSIDFHDFAWGYEWDCLALLNRISMEYPNVPIIFNHGGYSIGSYIEGADVVRKACVVAGRAIGPGGSNVYLETGSWPAEYYEIALKDPNVGVTQLIWGGDYGHVPQYILGNKGGDPPTFSTAMKRWPRVPTYQIDWWGWSLHQIDRLRDWVTQDEINLLIGGNAAGIWDLPVPHERMFMSGRPDVWGIHWEKSVPKPFSGR